MGKTQGKPCLNTVFSQKDSTNYSKSTVYTSKKDGKRGDRHQYF
jgi:hypothetical protein